MINVSVIIPAHNSANTIAETLDSLLLQTIPAWEAIIVDDGSTDGTLVIANEFSSKDQRIRTISQPNRGVSSARNIAIQNAHYDWLLFLDSDDWIAPEFLEVMTKQFSENPNLDVIHCGWNRIMPDGGFMGEQYAPEQSDLFPTLAQRCAFVIHACIVRKSLVEQVGLFDTTLHVCEDWDLWQKIARTGARFGAVKQVLSYYRMLPMSLSKDSHNFLEGAMRVLERGHTLDLRVSNSDSRYVNGASDNNLPVLKLYWSSWLAGLLIGQGKDIQFFSELIVEQEHLNLSANWIAENIFESVLLSQCQHASCWYKLWPQFEQKIHAFLFILEAKTQSIGIAHRTEIALERLVLNQLPRLTEPLFFWHTYAIHLDITEPFEDIYLLDKIERFYAMVEMEGDKLGTVELPVIDGLVSSWVIRDAIAAEFSWIILGRFFEHTIYQQRSTQENKDVTDWQAHHNQVGWTTFLQDLWDRPTWNGEAFYDAAYSDPASTFKLESDQLTIEVSDLLSDVSDASDELTVLATVGGIAIGQFTIPTHKGYVSAQALRVALTLEGGFELCRSVVREACIGHSIVPGMTLRRRLARAAKHRVHHQPASSIALSESFEKLSHTLILGHRRQLLGSSASRWATLPSQTAEDVLTMAQVTGEAIAQQPNSINRVVYAADSFTASEPQHQLRPALNSERRNNRSQTPSGTSKNRSDLKNRWLKPLISRSRFSTAAAYLQQSRINRGAPSVQAEFNNRDYFETLFATQPDPWKYTTDYEQVKYEQTLSLLPKHEIQRALELACAEGHFTVQLAPHVQSLLATDISQVAVERAAHRCNEFSHIKFRQLDMAADPLPDSLQLIVCSEVLYYIGGWKNLRDFAKKVVNALEIGGYFLTAHAHLVVDEPNRSGYNWDHPFGAKGISDTFKAIGQFQLVNEIHTPLYRIQLFQKKRRSWLPWPQSSPSVVKLPQPTAPPEAIIHKVLWQGGTPCKTEVQSTTTNRLPILMYHCVAPEGAAAMNRWRVTPDAFEEQLNYLRDAGYYTVGLETWQRAIITKTPLPGRAILLTFDDGYLDFLTYAYPLLQAYGFSATVFLVANHVGQSNQWDNIYGEDIPLMTWPQIRQLQAQGIEFGSHSASHRPLTSLSVEDIVREGVRSRTILTQELGTPVQTIAYPYGDVDPVVQHLIGACGYTIGLSCRSGKSSFQDSSLLLPRIEVEGSTSLQEFVNKLSKD